jgi:hypothetical protein
MLNIIVQGILRKKDVKERDPKKTSKTLMPPIGVQKHMAQDPHIGELDISGNYISLMQVGFPKGGCLHIYSKHLKVSYRKPLLNLFPWS